MNGSDPVCQLTESSMRLLGLVSDEPGAPPRLPIILHPDLSIEVPAAASLYTRFQLERFAERSGVRSSGAALRDAALKGSSPESEAPCCYRLTVGGLGRALAQGVRVEQVLAFLQQASDAPVPPNVAGQLQLWAGRFGQVQLEEVTLLRTQNEQVMKELTLLPATRSLIQKVLSPTSALVCKEDLPRLQKELRTLGYLPSAEETRSYEGSG
jgi:hypothetical protein